jgi:formylglycine-generating enzyme required for sulfatase activity
MAHWLDKVVEIMEAKTDDLRELARIAGYDPADFYRGTPMNGADLRGQDLTGMEFTDLDFSKVEYDEHTRFSDASIRLRFRDFDAAPEMIVVPAGEFIMGSADDEGTYDERPQHKVTIKSSFTVSVAPITRGEFAAFIRDTKYKIDGHSASPWRHPGFKQEHDHPVVCVNWNDAHAYAGWLRERSGGKGYRLLSEAEWEYCCRAGTTSAYSTGEGISTAQANFGRNSEGTTPVSRFPPNPWGLRDMHGNVWEWCEDNWHKDYNGNPPTDGSVWWGGDTSSRVVRGGSWDYDPLDLRTANRNWFPPDNRLNYVGFRVARTL